MIPLSTRMYKQVPKNFLLGGNPALGLHHVDIGGSSTRVLKIRRQRQYREGEKSNKFNKHSATTLHMQHTFFNASLPSLCDYDGKNAWFHAFIET